MVYTYRSNSLGVHRGCWEQMPPVGSCLWLNFPPGEVSEVLCGEGQTIARQDAVSRQGALATSGEGLAGDEECLGCTTWSLHCSTPTNNHAVGYPGPLQLLDSTTPALIIVSLFHGTVSDSSHACNAILSTFCCSRVSHSLLSTEST